MRDVTRRSVTYRAWTWAWMTLPTCPVGPAVDCASLGGWVWVMGPWRLSRWVRWLLWPRAGERLCRLNRQFAPHPEASRAISRGSSELNCAGCVFSPEPGHRYKCGWAPLDVKATWHLDVWAISCVLIHQSLKTKASTYSHKKRLTDHANGSYSINISALHIRGCWLTVVKFAKSMFSPPCWVWSIARRKTR